MTLRTALLGIARHEDLNFLLTNRIPRRLATRFVGWLSQIRQPQVRDVSMWAWRLFSDLDLSDARKTRFDSLHDCFIRELKPGARPIDPEPGAIVSPCDAIVGAFGPIEGTRLFQVKGFPYRLEDLLGSAEAAEPYRDGLFVTLRLTASMYHRFHAPHDGRVEAVTYMSGDTWNVNPIALKRIENLFCRNERAAIRLRLDATGEAVTLVAVAAILVASVRLRFLDPGLDLRAGGPRTIPCDAPLAKGDEMGWFQHGSTIVMLAPRGYAPCAGICEGRTIRVGRKLLALPQGPGGLA
ncbi:archaetidylserine decarboxylase [Methylobacterium oryzihabitans]|uniref:phosphatidylserine decarboxylase n=1 Tax=Methylobacterium oryzihabitans TaxID=2499852 RepID=A0A3S2V8H4_9HYPH|nr:archaetidylserine decarboxylase [Methylobacterium oryzihabitans]RVU16445.1 phosphatidylserine decarboxylase [Methylobacterium oryzihabitans]